MAIRFPSIDYLVTQIKHSLSRFPLTIFSAMVGVILAIYLIETESDNFNRFPYINAMLCAALGISLYFCVTILAIRQGFSHTQNILSHFVVTVILVVVFFTLPSIDSTHNIAQPYIRFAFYTVIVHLLVSFIPFLFTHQINGFWNYNKALFLRLLTSALYSGFLYVGLVLALLALKLLFDVEIPEVLYFELFVVIVGLFNTWFFLAGIPLDFGRLDSTSSYPNGLIGEAKIYMETLGLPFISKNNSAYDKYYSYRSVSSQLIDVKGYDLMIDFGQLYYSDHGYKMEDSTIKRHRKTVKLNGEDFTIAFSPDDSDMLIIVTPNDSIYFSVNKLIKDLQLIYKNDNRSHIPASKLSIDTVDGNRFYRLIIDEITFQSIKGEEMLQSMNGKLLVGKRDTE